MQSISQSKSGSDNLYYSDPASPQRFDSVSTTASASTSSTTLSKIHFNSYFGAIPEEGDLQTEKQSERPADVREGVSLDASSTKIGDDDDDRYMATDAPISCGKSPVSERKRALRRRSKPIVSGSTRPRLAVERRNSELESSERNGNSERESKSNNQAYQDCCSRKAAFTSCFGSKSASRFENEVTFVTEPNPLRSLAMSRRFLASSSLNSLSFVSFKHDDDCSIHHDSDRNREVKNEKVQIRGIEDRQHATVLLKSDIHDKRAFRLRTASSSPLASSTSLGPYVRLRRTSSAPVTSRIHIHESGRHDAYVGSSAQGFVEEINNRQFSFNTTERCTASTEVAKYDGNNQDENNCDDDDDDETITSFLRSWRTSCSDDRHDSNLETGKRTGHPPERFLPPLKIWMIPGTNEIDERRGCAQGLSAPEAAHQKTGKSNQAGPATTHTDVHVIALLPTESPDLENSEYFPKLTTAQVIETNESKYEVIWQENARNSATGVNEKQSDGDNRKNYGQSPLRTEHGLERVTKKLENWFWQDWTRDETCKKKMHDNEQSDKLSVQDGVTSGCSNYPLTTAKSMTRTDLRRRDDNVKFLAVPPNSVQSSQHSSRNPSFGYADDYEVAATAPNKLNHSKLYKTEGSKQESIAPPITSLSHAQLCFTSPLSSPLPLDSESQISPVSNATHEVMIREAKSIAAPEAASSSRERVYSTAVRRLSSLTMSELTFRKHRDSLLLTRQRLLSVGGGADTSISTAWPSQDSIVLNQKRLLRARKAQSTRALGSTRPMTLASPVAALIDIPRSRPQPAIYRLSALSGLSPILDVSPPAEHSRTGMMASVVDDKQYDAITASNIATTDIHRLRVASLCALDGAETFTKAHEVADDKQCCASLIADSDGGVGNSDAVATANIEMPVLVK